MTTPKDDDQDNVPRVAELRNDYSTVLERQLRNIAVNESAPHPYARFVHCPMESHVLLSACGEREEAFETPVKGDMYTRKRGRFSMALLKLLYDMPLDQLSYSEILRLLDPIRVPE